MTVQELIDALSAMPEADKRLSVQIQWWPTDGDELGVAEEIDTVLPPQSWGRGKNRVTLTSYS